MILLQRFKEFVQKENLFSPKDQLLLAVSGGIDSVVLCELCKQAGYDFVIAHCNFQLRGAESKRDAAFVQQLAAKYDVPFLVKEFDTENYAAANKLSIQEAARELRYGWFRELTGSPQSGAGSPKPEAENMKYNTPDSRLLTHDSLPTHLVTAHHLDDNIETMLMHFFRGTGVSGLRGMLPKQGELVRPLLFARKEELKKFGEEHKLNWVEDSSNALDKYTRNYFRNQVIPLLQKIYPDVDTNLINNLQRFADMEVLYEQSINGHRKKLLVIKGAEVHIPALKLKKALPLHTIVYEIIKDFGFSAHQTGEVIRLLESESGKYVRSATHRVIKNRNWLIIAPLQTEQSGIVLIEDGDTKIDFEAGRLTIKQLPVAGLPADLSAEPLAKARSIASLDAAAIRFPLILRKWKQGDYFYPLGMKKKKKVARFLIDQKLSLTAKEKVWVLEMNKKIVWVAGMRIDDRFKITPHTSHTIQIEWQPLH
jgi:tRNA(Ile)-lysidine synthase